jgi:hypothetical protein
MSDFDLAKEIASEMLRQEGRDPKFVATFHDGSRTVLWETKRDQANALVAIFRKYQERDALLAEAALRAQLASAIKERDTWDAAHTRQCQETRRQETRALAAAAESDRLRRALEPFANDWRAFPGCDPDGEPTKVIVTDFQRARQALKEQDHAG